MKTQNWKCLVFYQILSTWKEGGKYNPQWEEKLINQNVARNATGDWISSQRH